MCIDNGKEFSIMNEVLNYLLFLVVLKGKEEIGFGVFFYSLGHNGKVLSFSTICSW